MAIYKVIQASVLITFITLGAVKTESRRPLNFAVITQELLNEGEENINLNKTVISGIKPTGNPKSTTPYDPAFESESSPGCPKSSNGRPWIWYGNPPRCYLSNSQGPCPENMGLVAQEGSYFGVCSCCSLDPKFKLSDARTCAGRNEEYVFRIMYNKDEKTCQPLFEQGKCGESEWLNFGKDISRGPVCEKRSCAPTGNNIPVYGIFSFYDSETNLCHNLGDKCNLPANYNQKRSKVGQFSLSNQDWIPKCKDEDNSFITTEGFVDTTFCSKDQTRDKVTGNCVTKN